MGKWTVEGANRETGQDVRLSVEAASEAEALRKASKAGIMVSKIREQKSKAAEAAEALGSLVAEEPPVEESYPTEPAINTLEYAAPAAYAAPSRRAPAYEGILKGERLIRSCASLLSILGWVGIAVGATLCGFVVYAATSSRGPGITVKSMIAAGTPLVASLAYAIPCFIGAVMLRMYAALAIAVRDMARNSFG